jgi:membrane protein implicated in regulation of membrane protease activity
MNSGPIDPSTLAAFSLFPIVFILVWALASLLLLTLAIVAMVMLVRFVKAHERIAKQLEALVGQRESERKSEE